MNDRFVFVATIRSYCNSTQTKLKRSLLLFPFYLLLIIQFVFDYGLSKKKSILSEKVLFYFFIFKVSQIFDLENIK